MTTVEPIRNEVAQVASEDGGTEPMPHKPEEPVYDAVREQLEVDPEQIAARPRWEIPPRLDREWHRRRGQ